MVCHVTVDFSWLTNFLSLVEVPHSNGQGMRTHCWLWHFSICHTTHYHLQSWQPCVARYRNNLSCTLLLHAYNLAPEMLNSEPYTESVDTYAYGIILWEILTRDKLYKNFCFISDVASSVIAGERPPVPDWTPSLYKKLMTSCWVRQHAQLFFLMCRHKSPPIGQEWMLLWVGYKKCFPKLKIMRFVARQAKKLTI